MKIYTITADVYASWGDVHPCYRIFVDGDLLTERVFTWSGHEAYIREHIEVNLMPGEHNLTIEQVGKAGKIQIKNITVDGVASDYQFTIAE